MVTDGMLVVLAVGLRLGLWLGPYSGKDSPPMYGDLECQRHWMEVTTQLAVADWYRAGPHNDLLYWGLDYPPVAAALSWLTGTGLQLIEPAAVALGTASRGYATTTSVGYMRLTVLLCDVLVFVPAVRLLSRSLWPSAPTTKRAVAASLLLYPGLALIDHGHFQYNSFSLGLVLAAAHLCVTGHDWLGSAVFCLALMAKQMTLFFAPAFFAFLLGRSITLETTVSARVVRVLGLAAVVLATFSAVLLPFGSAVPDVLRRLFPVNRGLYEDKVANVWCTLSPVFKLHRLPHAVSFAVSVSSAVLGSVPACLLCTLRPSPASFVVALQQSALAFFLLSFQVHEKTVLLPIAALLLTPQPTHLFAAAISVLSMYPLLYREGLGLVAIAVVAGWLGLAGCLHYLLRIRGSQDPRSFLRVATATETLAMLVGAVAMAVSLLWFHVVPPPPAYPYLNEQAVTSVACAVFVAVYLAQLRALLSQMAAVVWPTSRVHAHAM